MMPSAPPVRLPPRYLPDLEFLGRGGFGNVYRATDIDTGLPVAVKVPYRGADIARELAAELEAVARLRHAGVVQIQDAGRDVDGQPWIVMEYAGEGTLARWIEEGPPPWPTLLRVLDVLLDALGHAHARGLVHRDIKGANVLLGRDAEGLIVPKLADFGLARVQAHRGEEASTRLTAGTLLYMAPEMFGGDRGLVHPTADLYAFGVLLYLLVGRGRPWDADDLALVFAKSVRPPRPLEVRGGYDAPPELVSLTARLLARAPCERPWLAAAVRTELRAISGTATQDFSSDGMSVRESVPTIPAARAIRVFPRDFPSGRPPDEFLVGPRVALVRTPRMVGRLPERQALWDAVGRAFQGPVGLSLQGGRGVGRTRLFDWLAESLEEEGLARPMRVRVDRDGVGEALARSVRRHLGIGRHDGDGPARLAAWLGDGVAPDEVAAFAVCLGLDGAENRAGDGTEAAGLRTRLLEAALRRFDGPGPSVLLVEDVTGAGRAAAVEWLRHAEAGAWPLFLGYDGPGGDGGDQGPPGFVRCVVPPMATSELVTLLRDLLPWETQLDALAGRAVGHPARAVEWARLLASRLVDGPNEAGNAARAIAEQGPFRSSDVATLDETEDVTDIAGSRVRAFEGSEIRGAGRQTLLLLLASVPPGTPRARVVAILSDALGFAATENERLVDEARVAGLLVEEEDGSLRFATAAIAAAVRARAPVQPGWRAIRFAAAVALSAPGTPPPDLLHAAALYLDCGDAERALPLAVEAGVALLGSDVELARSAFELSLAAATKQGLDASHPSCVLARVNVARAARAGGDLDGAEEALAAADGPGQASTGELDEVRASVRILRGDHAGALVAAERSAATYQQRRDGAGAARASILAADALLRAGRVGEAVARFALAVDEARATGAGREEAWATYHFARAQRTAGNRNDARKGLETAAEMARSFRIPALEGVALRELGNLAIAERRTASAESLLNAAIVRLERAGMRGETGVTRISLGELARARGSLEEARREYASALAITRAFGLVGDSLIALLDLAIVEIALGRDAAAARRIGEIDRLVAPSAPHRLRPYIEGVRLAVLCAQGPWDDAEETFCRLAGLGDQLPFDGDIRDLLESSGLRARAAREWTLATDALSLALEISRAMSDDAGAKRLTVALGSMG